MSDTTPTVRQAIVDVITDNLTFIGSQVWVEAGETATTITVAGDDHPITVTEAGEVTYPDTMPKNLAEVLDIELGAAGLM